MRLYCWALFIADQEYLRRRAMCAYIIKMATKCQATKKEPNIKWTTNDIQLIVNWLSERDKNGNLSNLNFYQVGNKLDVAMKFFVSTDLDISKPGVTKEKTRDRIGNMLTLYKKWRDKVESTGWGINRKDHDQPPDDGASSMTIRQILIFKCSFFYEFTEIMGTSPNVAPPYISESGHPDCVTIQDETGDIESQDNAKFSGKNT